MFIRVFVDLDIQYATPVCYFVIWGLSGSTTLFHFIPLKTKFSTCCWT